MKIGHFISLSLKNEIKDLYHRGSIIKSHSFNIKFLSSSQNKVIFIIKKKVGNAVKRNKIKRQLRFIISNSIFFRQNFVHLAFFINSSFDIFDFASINTELNSCFYNIQNKLF